MLIYLIGAIITDVLFLTFFKPLIKESIKTDVWGAAIMCLWGFMASVLWPLAWIMFMLIYVIVRYQYRG